MKPTAYIRTLLVMALVSLVQKLTAGRPMELVQTAVFYDQVTGYAVNRYRCGLGLYWLATNRWGWFRVPCDPPPAPYWRA